MATFRLQLLLLCFACLFSSFPPFSFLLLLCFPFPALPFLSFCLTWFAGTPCLHALSVSLTAYIVSILCVFPFQLMSDSAPPRREHNASRQYPAPPPPPAFSYCGHNCATITHRPLCSIRYILISHLVRGHRIVLHRSLFVVIVHLLPAMIRNISYFHSLFSSLFSLQSYNELLCSFLSHGWYNGRYYGHDI